MVTDWETKVYAVFSTSPRTGEQRGGLWIRRRQLEESVLEILKDPVVNICIDGPSGTGKTSLAKTMLQNSKRSYQTINVTSKMDWVTLCKKIIKPNINQKESTKSVVTGGIKNFIPEANATRENSQEFRPSDAEDYIEKVAANWSEDDVVSELRVRKIALILDNLEQANPELLQRLSDLAKGMSDAGPHASAKLVFIGANNIYAKLLNMNRSVSRRLEQVSVGMFTHQGESWNFLLKGFRKLNMYYPGNSLIKSENDLEVNCNRMVYRAAGGLPKSLNELGKKIALKARLGTGGHWFVSAKDIENCSNEFFDKLAKECDETCKATSKCLMKHPTARKVCLYLYQNSVGSIHSVGMLTQELEMRYSLSKEQIEQGIKDLIEVGFITRTGIGGSKLFVMQPEAAHILGVKLSSPNEFRDDPIIQGLSWQDELPGIR